MNAEETKWYEKEGSIEELIGFLISAGFIKKESAENFIYDIMDDPEEYTDVWELFKKNITGESDDSTDSTNGYDTSEEDIYIDDENFSFFKRYFSS